MEKEDRKEWLDRWDFVFLIWWVWCGRRFGSFPSYFRPQSKTYRIFTKYSFDTPSAIELRSRPRRVLSASLFLLSLEVPSVLFFSRREEVALEYDKKLGPTNEGMIEGLQINKMRTKEVKRRRVEIASLLRSFFDLHSLTCFCFRSR